MKTKTLSKQYQAFLIASDKEERVYKTISWMEEIAREISNTTDKLFSNLSKEDQVEATSVLNRVRS